MPRVKVPGGLESYILAANETTQELLNSDSPIMSVLRRYIDFFREDIWLHASPEPIMGNVLFMNAYLGLLAGVRMALSGHVAAIFPLLRSALESACYGLLMKRDSDMVAIWLDRHKSSSQRKACRKNFTVAKAAILLKEDHPSLYTLVTELYESSIDFGAHPNWKGVINHVSFADEDADGESALNLTGLYGPNASETTRGLFACLDFGLGIIAVIAFTKLNPSGKLVEEFLALDAAKTALFKAIQNTSEE